MGEVTSIWGRLRAFAHGEVPANVLEAYRRAGLTVFDLLKQTEDRRLALKIQGVNPWQVDPATQAEFLCAWNAFALQTLGDAFLDADYRAEPTTVGYVPPVTAAQVHAFYAHVEEWLGRAHEAATNPAYQLDVHVPADLPPWSIVEPCPRPHLEAMLAASEALRTHAESALAVFEAEKLAPENQVTLQQLRQLSAAAGAQADYAHQLGGGQIPQELHEQIEKHVQGALESYYYLGQLLAMPTLAAIGPSHRQASTPGATPPGKILRPGESGFDAWCLTDPDARTSVQRDPRAREAIAQIWEHDPDPGRTLANQAQIDAAFGRGDIVYLTTRSGARLGHYFCCPWAAVYRVKHPVTIGDLRLRPLGQFTYDVSAEGVFQGEPFKREILVANFEPTDKMDYCDPRSSDKHDDD